MSPNTVTYLLAAGVAGVVVFAVFYGDDQGWGAGLTLGLSFGALIVAAIVYVVYERVRRRRRRAAVPAAATALGLLPDVAGGPPLPAMPPFHLTSQGYERKAENVMSGQAGGGRVWLFDYTYATQDTGYHPGTGGVTSRYDHYFSCALAELPTALPAMRIGPEGFLSSLARSVGLEDIDVGSPDFDRRFKVEAAVPTIAREVLDAQMQQALGSLQDEMTFEVSDRWVLVFTKQRDPDELRPLLAAAQSFRDHLPRALLEAGGIRSATAPAAATAGDTSRAPAPAGLPTRAGTPFTALLAMFVFVVAATVSGLVAVAAFTEFEEPEMGVLLTIGAGVAAILAVVIPLWARSARRRRLEREAAATWGSGQPSAR